MTTMIIPEAVVSLINQNYATLLIGAITVLIIILQRVLTKPIAEGNTDISPGLRREQYKTSTTALNSMSQPNTQDKVLNPATFKGFKLLQVTKMSHNTKLLRFEIPHSKELGLSIGRHISVRAEIDGQKVMRAYTPTSRPDQKGYFDLLVKSYTDGKMSSYLHTLKVGQELEIRGPVGRFKYTKNNYRKIGLIAGGTGLTPCLQLIRCILEGPEGEGDDTEFVLFFQNRTEEDILMKDVLDNLVVKHSNRLGIHYFLSNSNTEAFASSKSNEHKGYISTNDINTHMKDKCEYVGMCGPAGFNDAMKELLVKASFNDDNIFIW